MLKKVYLIYIIILCASLLTACAPIGNNEDALTSETPSDTAPAVPIETTEETVEPFSVSVDPARYISPENIQKVGFFSGGNCVEAYNMNTLAVRIPGATQCYSEAEGLLWESWRCKGFPAEMPVLEYSDDFRYEIRDEEMKKGECSLILHKVDRVPYDYPTIPSVLQLSEKSPQSGPAGVYLAEVRIEFPATMEVPDDPSQTIYLGPDVYKFFALVVKN